jgi:DNA-binding transcriptional regulator YiaG
LTWASSTIFVENIAKKSYVSRMSPEQSRAARGWLGWSQRELAAKANVALSTVRDFEKGRHEPRAAMLAAMRRVIEEAGIRLVFGPSGEAAGIVRDDAGGAPSTAGGAGDGE